MRQSPVPPSETSPSLPLAHPVLIWKATPCFPPFNPWPTRNTLPTPPPLEQATLPANRSPITVLVPLNLLTFLLERGLPEATAQGLPPQEVDRSLSNLLSAS